MASKSTIIIILTATLTLAAPLLIALSALPESGRTLAVLMPPWMGREAQVLALAATGVTLRDGGGRLAGIGPPVWVVQAPDADSAARLSRLPALLMSGALVGCG